MDRNQALNLQETLYDADKPCRRGHMGKRYVSNGACVLCQAERQRRYSRAQVVAAQGVTLALSTPNRFAWILRGLGELLADPTRMVHHAAIEGFARGILGPAAALEVVPDGQAPGPDPEWITTPVDEAPALPALKLLPMLPMVRSAPVVITDAPPIQAPDNDLITVWRDGQWVQVPDPNPAASRD